MTEKRKDLLVLAALLLLMVIYFSKILFTDMIIRAPDIINEFYWAVLEISKGVAAKALAINLSTAGWDQFINSGHTAGGGGASAQFLLHLKLMFLLIPAPASVAWCIVLQLFFGATGMYLYCRTIGLSRIAGFLAGAIFVLAPEHTSLINAGHVMKIATITFAPWAFYCFEKGFKTRKTFWFMSTALVLAFQFFNTHWQIAFYTCLCIGFYGIIRSFTILLSKNERLSFPLPRLLTMNMVVLFFFLSTVAISLVPLADWSKDTNRGAQSGANQGKGGLERDEAMSWSLPPEEVVAFVIPGFFGLSRQEAGLNPPNIKTYYWGRMVFTQTTSYIGLLPWLLVPMPLIFRRDKYTWLAVAAIAGGLLFSMGKYTPFYNLLYDYFPGIDRFRVPKMMMFIPVMGLGVLAAIGMDLLLDRKIRVEKKFRYYLAGVVALPLMLLVFMGVLQVGKDRWIGSFIEQLAQPTRYEQGIQLVTSRWNNIMQETGIAAVIAALTAGAFVFWGRAKSSAKLLPLVLIALYVGDTWRINDKFMFLVAAPEKGRAATTPGMEFLARDSKQYRTLPMNGSDPMHYVSNKIPVMFTSNAVQQQRWQNYLDNFSIMSAMPDIMNVKYLVYSAVQYDQEKTGLASKFAPVFRSPDGNEVILENRDVLPKAWLVPSVLTVSQPQQALAIMQNPQFDPRKLAVVESPPPMPMTSPDSAISAGVGAVQVKRYEGEQIDLSVTNTANALLVMGEKYYKGWKATVDGNPAEIQRVNFILRGLYLPPGSHQVEFVFDPLPFKIGKYLTLTSFALFAAMLLREWRIYRKKRLAS